MASLKALLSALTLLALTVDASSGPGYSNYNYDLSGQQLTDLYNSPVYKAEWMVRPFGSSSSTFGPLSHTGVRVTLADGAQWLIHKGQDYGISSDTVVTSARHMSSAWKPVFHLSRQFNGRKKVADFVKRGGETYNALFNCHVASITMMLQ
ncbi:uncharacterized protein LOC121815770 [Haplochromis burtoni]|uniref:Uncharacterized protein n=1 Tax=Haplochromis burtoni TaxID=8153 RepID=A0A3Q2VLK0_HAPBU|nr:uncharacterized protein LOC121815770 [Haplochromis burtoni]